MEDTLGSMIIWMPIMITAMILVITAVFINNRCRYEKGDIGKSIPIRYVKRNKGVYRVYIDMAEELVKIGINRRVAVSVVVSMAVLLFILTVLTIVTFN